MLFSHYPGSIQEGEQGTSTVLTVSRHGGLVGEFIQYRDNTTLHAFYWLMLLLTMMQTSKNQSIQDTGLLRFCTCTP